MAKTSEIISKLQELVDKNGDQEITIYKSFDKTTTKIKVEEIFFDDNLKDIYIAIYN